jgi:hypothetical protein
VSEDRSLVLPWYGGLLGGLLPVLLLGFIYSAVADRTAFALWALVMGTAWVVVLHRGLAAGLRRPRLLAVLAAVLAVGFAAFAWLESRHHEILDLGFRAVFPSLYTPAATSPRTVYLLAAACFLTGAAALIVSLLSREKLSRAKEKP